MVSALAVMRSPVAVGLEVQNGGAGGKDAPVHGIGEGLLLRERLKPARGGASGGHLLGRSRGRRRQERKKRLLQSCASSTSGWLLIDLTVTALQTLTADDGEARREPAAGRAGEIKQCGPYDSIVLAVLDDRGQARSLPESNDCIVAGMAGNRW